MASATITPFFTTTSSSSSSSSSPANPRRPASGAAHRKPGSRVQSRGTPRNRGTVLRIVQDGSQPQQSSTVVEVQWDDGSRTLEQSEVDLRHGHSAIESIKFRYGESPSTDPNTDILIIQRTFGSIQVTSLRHISLADMDVSHLGPPDEFAQYTSQLRELDLSATLLSSWSDIFAILKSSPLLTSLNLSRNRFQAFTDEFPDVALPTPAQPPQASWVFPALQTLALNHCCLAWEDLNLVLSLLPNLAELYLSGNNFQTIEFASPEALSISLLQLNGNQIRDWDQVWKLGAMPRLETLFLTENPLSAISYTIPPHMQQADAGLASAATTAAVATTEEPSASERHLPFSKLRNLALNQTAISDWDSVDALASFPALRDLKLRDVPVLGELKERERRNHLVARLPKVRTLNASSVTSSEREAAERSFIRHFKYLEPKPQRFDALVKLHGVPEDLVEIDLRPPEFARVRIICTDPEVRVSEYQVRLKSTVAQLKKELMQNVFLNKLDAGDMRLFYCDPEVRNRPSSFSGAYTWTQNARTEMASPDCQLFTYRVRDGIEIHVRRCHVLATYY